MSTARSATIDPFWLKIAGLLGLFIAAYWVPLRGMVNVWQSNEDYSYGFIIPMVTLYLLWDKRSLLLSTPVRSSWRVLPLLLIFILVSIYGVLGSSGNIAMPVVPILIVLFAAFCLGTEFARKALLPLGFLIFMVPIPAVLERTIGTWLKSVSSVLGGSLVRLFGIPVHVSGNLIDLGVTKLQVVDACNGLRYLFPLLAIGVIYSYLFERTTWKRIFCVIATLPIAVLINSLRIGITGILANWYGAAAAEGFFHDFTGWVLFMVAFVLLYLLGRVLTFFPPRQKKGVVASPAPMPAGATDAINGRISNRVYATALVLLVAVAALSWSTSALPAVKLRGGIESFPTSFAGWQGTSTLVDPEIVRMSGAEEAFSGQYANENREQVSLYIGYRSTAFLESENFFHSPTVCLPSNGMKTTINRTRTISGIPRWGDLTVTEMVTEGLGSRMLVYFWFQTKDRATYDKNINRYHLTLHALTRDNTYDLFLRPIAQLQPTESIADGEKRLDRFVRDLSPEMLRFINDRRI
ncbi:EpsI family protein [Geobacter pelophilus]|uniref:EpsI family protein n=1 Tax=Geoanaerobacter pelophilus TaxID=60036 RepID=A0AAW4LDV3_9BACT|nr:exosortase C-terminal domain/associated protein EpsI [Geoanaerobacter pelophilus]MBT0666189.1 EpsI family protein [Geoanaerobacter pelophilus]